jgi:predicted negative regulator of RcsB-dependent stress response
MDEEISIINSNSRSEKVRNFFVNNKNKIISLVVILIVVLVGAFSFEKYQTNKKKEISNKFNSTTISYSEKTKELTAKKLVEIINEQDPTYSPLGFILYH